MDAVAGPSDAIHPSDATSLREAAAANDDAAAANAAAANDAPVVGPQDGERQFRRYRRQKPRPTTASSSVPEDLRLLSVRAGLWLVMELRRQLKEQAEDVLRLSRGKTAASEMSERIEGAWCRNLERNAGLGDFLRRSEEVAKRSRTGKKRKSGAFAAKVTEVFAETREERVARVLKGRPAPYMPWPQWAARPWAKEKRQRLDDDDSSEEKRTKWRRKADADDTAGFSVVETESLDDDFRRRVLETKEKLRDDRRDRRRHFGEEFSRLSSDDDDASCDSCDSSESSDFGLHLEHLEEVENDATWETLNRRFVDVAAEKRMPTFFPTRKKAPRRRVSLSEEMDLGIDAAAVDPPPMKAVMHGRLRQVTVAKRHVLTIPRAVAVVKGDLHVLYDCTLRLPRYWADIDTKGTIVSDKVLSKTTGLKQYRKTRHDDPIANPAVLDRITARCSKATLAACYAASQPRPPQSTEENTAPSKTPDREEDIEIEDIEIAADIATLRPAALTADLTPILLALDSSSDEDDYHPDNSTTWRLTH